MKKDILNKVILIGLFIFLSFIYIYSIVHKNIISYNVISYYLTYELGFISRGFIGSIIDLFPKELFFHILYGLCVGSVTVIFSYCLKQIWNIYKKIENKEFLTIFLGSFFSVISVVLFLTNDNSKFDIYNILLFLIILYLHKVDHKYKFILSIILSIIGLLIHQVFIFMIMPFIFLLFIDKNEYKNGIMYGIITCIVFLICQFLGKVDYNTVLDFVRKKQLETNYFTYLGNAIDKTELMLTFEYNTSILGHFNLSHQAYQERIDALVVILMFSVFYLILFIKQICLVFKGKLKYILFLVFSQLPLYVLTLDVDRWFLVFILNLNLFMFHFLQQRNCKIDYKLKRTDIVLLVLNFLICMVFVQFKT